MAKVPVDFRKDFAETMETMWHRGGLLLSAQSKSHKANTMVIGWGMMGEFWGKPIWCVLVRPSRHTFQVIEEAKAFTVSVPTPAIRSAVEFAGKKSGRDFDKFKETGLTFVPSEKTGQPIIQECSLTYDCRVVTQNDFVQEAIPAGVLKTFYPQNDLHRLYFGEILETLA